MLCFIIIMINFNQLINNQFPYREFNIHYRFVTYQITIMLSLQVPVHAREPGFSISAWIQRTRYHERQIGTDERLVPVQRKGAIRVNSQSLWQPPNFSNIFRLELFIRLARSIEKKKTIFTMLIFHVIFDYRMKLLKNVFVKVRDLILGWLRLRELFI